MTLEASKDYKLACQQAYFNAIGTYPCGKGIQPDPAFSHPAAIRVFNSVNASGALPEDVLDRIVAHDLKERGFRGDEHAQLRQNPAIKGLYHCWLHGGTRLLFATRRENLHEGAVFAF